MLCDVAFPRLVVWFCYMTMIDAYAYDFRHCSQFRTSSHEKLNSVLVLVKARRQLACLPEQSVQGLRLFVNEVAVPISGI